MLIPCSFLRVGKRVAACDACALLRVMLADVGSSSNSVCITVKSQTALIAEVAALITHSTSRHWMFSHLANSHQLGFVAHHDHMCPQARISEQSLLSLYPKL